MTKDLNDDSRKPSGPRTNRGHKTSSRRPARRSPKGEAPDLARVKAGWSPERRARQAEFIRSIQPWLKSTGPRTEAGKARSAANAWKHGFRSRPFIERVREERRLVREAARTIALAKFLLRALAVRSTLGPHVTVWTGDPDLDSRRAQPSAPVKPL